MESSSEHNLITPTRQEALNIWISREGLSHARIARALGLTQSAVSKMLKRDTAPVHRVEQLREFGIPLHLLPQPVNLKPGPKPRSEAGEAA